jgi:hypothetical protein
VSEHSFEQTAAGLLFMAQPHPRSSRGCEGNSYRAGFSLGVKMGWRSGRCSIFDDSVVIVPEERADWR